MILTSPPYPDARKVEAYGAEFDTSMAGYQKLGDAVFEALKPGGVCALNIDGPVRIWRPELGESERSLIAFKVAIDWAERVGFRYIEHCAYVRDGVPGLFGPRWRSGWEPMHIFSKPGGAVYFDHEGATLPAMQSGRRQIRGTNRSKAGRVENTKNITKDRRQLTTAFRQEFAGAKAFDIEHEAPFSRQLADAYTLCYSPPGGLVGDPFVGSGVAPYC